ncbi:MAG: translation initiation factor IF-2 [Bacillota bacterium]|nr:translation initiation factor IF-2 [Bacillota bacterium]
MKVKELAVELQLTGKEVLEKAKAMGISVSKLSDEFSDMDAKAVRNTIARSRSQAETKVVRAKARKADGEKTAAGKAPVKATKQATIAMPEARMRTTKKATIAMPNQTKPAPARPAQTKAAAVKPVMRRTKPAVDEPKVSKAMLEERIAREKEAAAKAKAEARAAKIAEEEARLAANETPVEAEAVLVRQDAAEAKSDAGANPEAEGKDPAASAEKTTIPAEAENASLKAKKAAFAEEKPRNRSRLKVVKSAEEVHREEALAAEKRRARREEGARKPSAERRTGERRSSERRPEGRKPASGAVRPTRRPDAPPASSASKSSAHGRKGRERDHDKDRDKFARLEGRGKKTGRPEPKSLEKQTRAKRHSKPRAVVEPDVEVMDLPAGTILINVPITVAGFAEQTKTTVSQIIMTLMKMSVMANVNQNLDEDTVVLLAEEMGISIAIGNVNREEDYEVEDGIESFEDKESDLKPRAPIITVMGHVDHGKTSLLDAIRKTNVTDQESGGITQHIGASEVESNGQKIVFLDTPGHEAFTAMRARGAHATDIAVLVVAADDSVKPQTIESISHARSAGVPIIVAINKMDKPGANPDIVKKDLADQGVLVEDWGGEVISVPVSAKTGEGIKNLLEMILLQAEVLELKANTDRLAMGTVLEARLDKAKGPVASLLVLNGTLKSGASIVAGTCAGKIRLMTNSKGEKLRKAGPATAVEILGLTEVPQAGDVFNAVKSPAKAREIAYNRQQKVREEIMARNSSTTLEELFSQIQAGVAKELNLIIKADVQGSVGAIVSSLEKLSNDEVKVNIVHTGVGAINESDVMLAGTSDSVIIGFNVRPSTAVSAQADRDGIQIRTYNVIYHIIDDVENAMKGMLDPEFREVVLGAVDIRTTFKVPGVGIVGGAYVTDGKVVRNEQIRLVRDGIVIHEGRISSLKRFKDDAKEVAQGFECGIGIENYNDIKEGDIIECFTMEEIERV